MPQDKQEKKVDDTEEDLGRDESDLPEDIFFASLDWDKKSTKAPAEKPAEQAKPIELDKVEIAFAKELPPGLVSSPQRAFETLKTVKPGEPLTSEQRKAFESALSDAGKLNQDWAKTQEAKLVEEVQKQERKLPNGQTLPPWTIANEKKFFQVLEDKQRAMQELSPEAMQKLAQFERNTAHMAKDDLRRDVFMRLLKDEASKDPKLANYLDKQANVEKFTSENAAGLVRRSMHQQEMMLLHAPAVVSGLYAIALDRAGQKEDQTKLEKNLTASLRDRFAPANIPELVMLMEKYKLEEKQEKQLEDKIPGRAELKKALEIMNDPSQGSDAERLEKARPFFQKAIGASDQLDPRKVAEEIEKVSKERNELGDAALAEKINELENKAVELVEQANMPMEARVRFAAALQNAAVEKQDRALADQALAMLKAAQRLDPALELNASLTGAIANAQKEPLAKFDEKANEEAGKPLVEKRKQELIAQGKRPDDRPMWQKALGTGAEMLAGIVAFHLVSKYVFSPIGQAKNAVRRSWEMSSRLKHMEMEASPQVKDGENGRLIVKTKDGQELPVESVRKEDGRLRVFNGEKSEELKLRRGDKLVMQYHPDKPLSKQEALEKAAKVLAPVGDVGVINAERSRHQDAIAKYEAEMAEMRQAQEELKAQLERESNKTQPENPEAKAAGEKAKTAEPEKSGEKSQADKSQDLIEMTEQREKFVAGSEQTQKLNKQINEILEPLRQKKADGKAIDPSEMKAATERVRELLHPVLNETSKLFGLPEFPKDRLMLIDAPAQSKGAFHSKTGEVYLNIHAKEPVTIIDHEIQHKARQLDLMVLAKADPAGYRRAVIESCVSEIGSQSLRIADGSVERRKELRDPSLIQELKAMVKQEAFYELLMQKKLELKDIPTLEPLEPSKKLLDAFNGDMAELMLEVEAEAKHSLKVLELNSPDAKGLDPASQEYIERRAEKTKAALDARGGSVEADHRLQKLLTGISSDTIGRYSKDVPEIAREYQHALNEVSSRKQQAASELKRLKKELNESGDKTSLAEHPRATQLMQDLQLSTRQQQVVMKLQAGKLNEAREIAAKLFQQYSSNEAGAFRFPNEIAFLLEKGLISKEQYQQSSFAVSEAEEQRFEDNMRANKQTRNALKQGEITGANLEEARELSSGAKEYKLRAPVVLDKGLDTESKIVSIIEAADGKLSAKYVTTDGSVVVDTIYGEDLSSSLGLKKAGLDRENCIKALSDHLERVQKEEASSDRLNEALRSTEKAIRLTGDPNKLESRDSTIISPDKLNEIKDLLQHKAASISKLEEIHKELKTNGEALQGSALDRVRNNLRDLMATEPAMKGLLEPLAKKLEPPKITGRTEATQKALTSENALERNQAIRKEIERLMDLPNKTNADKVELDRLRRNFFQEMRANKASSDASQARLDELWALEDKKALTPETTAEKLRLEQMSQDIRTNIDFAVKMMKAEAAATAVTSSKGGAASQGMFMKLFETELQTLKAMDSRKWHGIEVIPLSAGAVDDLGGDFLVFDKKSGNMMFVDATQKSLDSDSKANLPQMRKDGLIISNPKDPRYGVEGTTAWKNAREADIRSQSKAILELLHSGRSPLNIYTVEPPAGRITPSPLSKEERLARIDAERDPAQKALSIREFREELRERERGILETLDLARQRMQELRAEKLAARKDPALRAELERKYYQIDNWIDHSKHSPLYFVQKTLAELDAKENSLPADKRSIAKESSRPGAVYDAKAEGERIGKATSIISDMKKMMSSMLAGERPATTADLLRSVETLKLIYGEKSPEAQRLDLIAQELRNAGAADSPKAPGDTTARELYDKIPERVKKSPPPGYNADLKDALSELVEEKRSSWSPEKVAEYDKLLKDYESGDRAAIDKVTSLLAEGKSQSAASAQNKPVGTGSLPQASVDKPAAELTQRYTTPELTPEQARTQQAIETLSSADGMRYIESIPIGELTVQRVEEKLRDIDKEIARAKEAGRSDYAAKLEEMKKAYESKSTPQEREAFCKQMHETLRQAHETAKEGTGHGKAAGLAGKAGTVVALLMVAGWMLDVAAPKANAASSGPRVLPSKR